MAAQKTQHPTHAPAEADDRRARQAEAVEPDARNEAFKQAALRAGSGEQPKSAARGKRPRVPRDQRGDKPRSAAKDDEQDAESEQDTDQDEEEQQAKADSFWQGLAAGAYRSRLRRGEWDD